jgi:hypothetical protein
MSARSPSSRMSLPATLRRAELAARWNLRASCTVPRSMAASISLASDAINPISRFGFSFTAIRMSLCHTGAKRRLSSGIPAS